MSQGDTPEEAMEMIQDALQGWLATALAQGFSIPEPRREDDYSGKFVVRMAKSLHRKLAQAAERDGVSLNQWINMTLAGLRRCFSSVRRRGTRQIPEAMWIWGLGDR